MRKRFLVSGQVQGVGFRFFARRVATRLGLAGWVKNLSDGHVEAVAEGGAEALAAFAAELRRGPPWASVTNVQESEDSDAVEPLKGFEIL